MAQAGTSCAWQLRRAGVDVAILDKSTFPRNKVCGGWITLPVFDELEIDATEYARTNVLQPITGFRTSMIGDRETETDYGKPISYGIRRSEFDDYLLKRSNARLIEGTALSSVERNGDEWLVNGQIKTQLIVGAGGHFCPVARFMGSKSTRRKRSRRPGNRIRNDLRPANQMLDSPRNSRTLFLCGHARLRLVLPKRNFHQYRPR